jgi:hypothetical protein
MDEKIEIFVHVERCVFDPEDFVSVRITGINSDMGPNVRSLSIHFRMRWSRRDDALGVALLMKPIQKALKVYNLNLSNLENIAFR